jgi:hypothetical protein
MSSGTGTTKHQRALDRHMQAQRERHAAHLRTVARHQCACMLEGECLRDAGANVGDWVTWHPPQGTMRLAGVDAFKEFQRYETSVPGRLYWWDRSYTWEGLTVDVLGRKVGHG